MSNYPVRDAWKAYKEGRLEDALNLFYDAAEKIGINLFRENIQFIENKLRKNCIVNNHTDLIKDKKNISLDDFTQAYPVDPGCCYKIIFELNENIGNSHGIFSIENLDENKNCLPPHGNHPISEIFGCYEYIVKNREIKYSITTAVANNAKYILLKGKTTKKDKKIQLVSLPKLEKISNFGDQIEKKIIEKIEAVPQTAQCLLISTTAGSISLGNSLILRSARLAKYFSEQGWHVFYCPFNSKIDIDTEIKINDHLIQIPRNILPVVMDTFFKRRGKNNVFLCSSFSDLFATYSIDRLAHQNWKIVYEIRDDMEEFNRAGYSKWYDPSFEKRVAERSDIIIATAPRLQDKISSVTSRNDVYLIPNAAPKELIKDASFLRTEKSAKIRSKYKKVGYIGHLTDSWFDWPWLITSAIEHPDITIEIIGKGIPSNIALPDNINYLGEKSHQECLEYVRFWSAGLIPFIISRLTLGVSPNKAYEYVAMGLRIISAPMGQVSTMPSAFIYKKQKELSSMIKKAVSTQISNEELTKMNDYVLHNSWNNRYESLCKILKQ